MSYFLIFSLKSVIKCIDNRLRMQEMVWQRKALVQDIQKRRSKTHQAAVFVTKLHKEVVKLSTHRFKFPTTKNTLTE